MADRQRAFVTDYLETATTDTDASWQMLTPRYQQESGRDSYEGFWSLNESAQVSEITPDPSNDQVSYTVTYGRAGGETTSPERVTLQLVPEGDSFLIDDQL